MPTVPFAVAVYSMAYSTLQAIRTGKYLSTVDVTDQQRPHRRDTQLHIFHNN